MRAQGGSGFRDQRFSVQSSKVQGSGFGVARQDRGSLAHAAFERYVRYGLRPTNGNCACDAIHATPFQGLALVEWECFMVERGGLLLAEV